MNREELLAAIRKIVGRKFQFSEAYAKKCGGYPTLGAENRMYSILTREYIYIPCRVIYGWNADETEFGVFFHRYSLYKSFYGKNVNRVKLEDLFTKDLQKIYDDLVFYLDWERNVRLPKIEKEYEECKKYADIYNKLLKIKDA